MRVGAVVIAVLGLSLPRFADAAADALSVQASLSDTTVPVGDIVTLEVRAVARVDGDIVVDVPRVDGLSELSRSQSEGTSISWTNQGQSVTRERTIMIELQADRSGRVDIPPIVARVGSHQAKSVPLALNVGESATPPPGGAPAAGEVTPPGAGERDVFVRVRVDKNEVFLGEQLLLDCEVFANPGTSFNIDSGAPPSAFDGFWTEVVDRPQRLTRRVEQVGRQTYHVYRLWRVALFPLKAGETTIPTHTITLSQNRSIFGSGKRTRRRTVPLSVTVKPLPTEGRPADFSNNNVGQYLLTASLDHDRVKAGKAVLLRLSMSGVGNIKAARLPEVKAIDGFRVFPPTVVDEADVTPNGLRGTKTAEILLMPERGGRLEIPSFAVTVFDPTSASYERRTTDSLRLVVEGTPTPSAEPPPPSSQEPSSAGLDLIPVRFRSSLTKRDSTPWRRPWFVGALAAPWVLFVLGLGVKRLRARQGVETAETKRRAVQKAARSQLVEAKAALDRRDLPAAYARFAEAVTEYGSDKCGVALRGLTADGVRAALVERGAPAELAQHLAEELEAADYARFAPGTVANADPGDLHERWERIFAGIDAMEVKS